VSERTRTQRQPLLHAGTIDEHQRSIRGSCPGTYSTEPVSLNVSCADPVLLVEGINSPVNHRDRRSGHFNRSRAKGAAIQRAPART
jgi:hypothetical protein